MKLEWKLYKWEMKIFLIRKNKECLLDEQNVDFFTIVLYLVFIFKKLNNDKKHFLKRHYNKYWNI
jgi:hypothetical protein